MRPKRRTLLGQATLLALVAGGADAQVRAAGAAAAELRLGAIYPFAGASGLLGDESFRGLELAVEARNAAGGVQGRPLRLVKAEAADAAQAGEAVRRLGTGAERVAALFGSCSSTISFAATQAAELQGIPYFELGAVSDSITTRGFRYVFRSCPRGAEIAALSLHATRRLLPGLWRMAPSDLRVAILHEDTLYGEGIATAQEAGLREGVTLLGRFNYTAPAREVPALAQRLRTADAHLLLHTGQDTEILLLFRAFKEMGWRPRMVLGAGAGYSLVDTAQALGRAFEGVMSAGFMPYASGGRAGGEASALAAAYRAKYGHDPRSSHSLANHAGAGIFLEALHRAGSTEKERIRAAVLGIELTESEAPLGWAADFEESGQNIRAQPVLSQWQGGRMVPVFPEAAAVATLRPEIG